MAMFMFKGEVNECFCESYKSKDGTQGEKTTLVVTNSENAEFPETAAFIFFAEKGKKCVEALNAAEGRTVEVKFAVNSRENDGRYYTDLRGIGWTLTEQQKQPMHSPTTQVYGRKKK